MQILVENIYNENLATALFMILITVAVGIFVYFGTLKNKYDLADFWRRELIEEIILVLLQW